MADEAAPDFAHPQCAEPLVSQTELGHICIARIQHGKTLHSQKCTVEMVVGQIAEGNCSERSRHPRHIRSNSDKETQPAVVRLDEKWLTGW